MTDASDVTTIEILLVEDDADDERRTKTALKQAEEDPRIGVPIRINVSAVGDGVEAMAFLRKEGEHTESLRPALILLDINLPRMDGWEVLRLTGEDANLKNIPVVIMTKDARPVPGRFVAFMRKPIPPHEFVDVVRKVLRILKGEPEGWIRD